MVSWFSNGTGHIAATATASATTALVVQKRTLR